jgi:hypothetical protein
MTLHQQSADPVMISRHLLPLVPSLGQGCPTRAKEGLLAVPYNASCERVSAYGESGC